MLVTPGCCPREEAGFPGPRAWGLLASSEELFRCVHSLRYGVQLIGPTPVVAFPFPRTLGLSVTLPVVFAVPFPVALGPLQTSPNGSQSPLYLLWSIYPSNAGMPSSESITWRTRSSPTPLQRQEAQPKCLHPSQALCVESTHVAGGRVCIYSSKKNQTNRQVR